MRCCVNEQYPDLTHTSCPPLLGDAAKNDAEPVWVDRHVDNSTLVELLPLKIRHNFIAAPFSRLLLLAVIALHRMAGCKGRPARWKGMKRFSVMNGERVFSRQPLHQTPSIGRRWTRTGSRCKREETRGWRRNFEASFVIHSGSLIGQTPINRR